MTTATVNLRARNVVVSSNAGGNCTIVGGTNAIGDVSDDSYATLRATHDGNPLHDYNQDIITFTFDDMPDIDPDLIIHRWLYIQSSGTVPTFGQGTGVFFFGFYGGSNILNIAPPNATLTDPTRIGGAALAAVEVVDGATYRLLSPYGINSTNDVAWQSDWTVQEVWIEIKYGIPDEARPTPSDCFEHLHLHDPDGGDNDDWDDGSDSTSTELDEGGFVSASLDGSSADDTTDITIHLRASSPSRGGLEPFGILPTLYVDNDDTTPLVRVSGDLDDPLGGDQAVWEMTPDGAIRDYEFTAYDTDFEAALKSLDDVYDFLTNFPCRVGWEVHSVDDDIVVDIYECWVQVGHTCADDSVVYPCDIKTNLSLADAVFLSQADPHGVFIDGVIFSGPIPPEGS